MLSVKMMHTITYLFGLFPNKLCRSSHPKNHKFLDCFSFNLLRPLKWPTKKIFCCEISGFYNFLLNRKKILDGI